MKAAVAGPKAKYLGSITERSGRDASCDWSYAVVIGPKAKDVGAGADARVGPSFSCGAVGSKMAVGGGRWWKERS